ncbi:alpha/beta hydrolase [Citricoccus sp.]|uniref:alpha/beta hydrolase n=1 Tax=Citricoccus sp. TaxID=1978372 RepID=UPI0028BF2CC5|nr:alpha/beta hydrolase [Citricoccus sp.]
MNVAEIGVNLAAWIRDYVYALRRQAAGVAHRYDPQAYRQSGTGQPAVVLIPGIYESWTFMLPVADALRENGFDVHAVTDLRYNGGTIEEMADLVDKYLRRERVGRCVLVAHSKGGLVGKLLLAHHHEGGAIRGLVAVNTPFTGSPLARLLPLPALRVFLPNSPELAELSASSHVDRDIVSIYGRFDPHIPGGSCLEGAHNMQLGTRGHFLPLGDRRVHAAILEGIRRLAG